MRWVWLVGALLVLEGLMPLLFTQAWRQTFSRLLQLRDGQLRFIGAVSVLAGLVLLILG